jgi:hypothetical protein
MVNTKTDLYALIWADIDSRNPALKVALYGGGLMLKPFMEARHTKGAKVDCVLDDNVKGEAYGLPIVKPQDASRRGIQAIIVTSDFREDEIKERVRNLCLCPAVGMSDYFKEHDLDWESYWHLPSMHVKGAPKVVRNSGPKFLTCVMTCFGCSDFLHYTLPWNLKQVDRMVVVTSIEDVTTQQVCRANGVTPVLSESWRLNDAAFNKGAMLNAGLRQAQAGWILFSDADCLLPSDFKSRLKDLQLDLDTLYSARRYTTPTNEHDRDVWLAKFKVEGIIGKITPMDNDPVGYFQLWNTQAQPVRQKAPVICHEGFHNAGAVDVHFYRMFNDNIAESGFHVVHIWHGNLACNWDGRKSSPLPGAPEPWVPKPKNEGWMMIGYAITRGYQALKPMPSNGILRIKRADNGDEMLSTPKMFSARGNSVILCKDGLQYGYIDGKQYWASKPIGHTDYSFEWRKS